MLGKLFKYDMRANSRMLFPATLFVFATTLLGTFALRLSNQGLTIFRDGTLAGDIFNTLMGLIFTLSVFTLIVYTAAAFILVLIHYYRNLFSDEGYLTFTLPVSTSSILTSKLLVSTIWLMLTGIVTILCILIYTTFGYVPRGELINTEFYEELFRFLSEIGKVLGTFHGAFFTIELIVLTIFSMYMGIIQAFLSITIGAIIAKKHKIIAAIGIYYIINIIISTASTVVMMILLSNSVFLYEMTTYDIFSGDNWWYIHMIFIIYILLTVIISVAEHLINNHILKKKLNI